MREKSGDATRRADSLPRPSLSRARPRLLTPAQAAAFLTLKESTLRDYARRGLVPSVKLGRHMRFVEADLVDHLERLRRSPR